ncbi:unnamed protein product [marine sediment metagenome]|uniref:Uncharacterized protein n=3 Tax=marine sediment metagenome TaxID=412755 RepID=X1DEN4_9ZZZZ
MRVEGLSSLVKKEITLYGQNYALASLDAEEKAVLEDNFNKLLGTTDSQVRRIFEERADTIVAGIMAIKEKLEGRKFRGMNPGDAEIGFGFIRPEFVKDTGAIINDWNVTLSGMATWDTWLSNAGDTAGEPLSEDHGLIITHLVSQVTPQPFIRAVHFLIGRVDLIPEEVADILLGDNENGVAVFPIPTKIVLPEDELRLNVTGLAGTEYLKLGGLVVGLGRLLKAETPSW